MDTKVYLKECSRMARLKRLDDNVSKVFADVNFDKLIKQVLDHIEKQDQLAFAEKLFENVSH